MYSHLEISHKLNSWIWSHWDQFMWLFLGRRVFIKSCFPTTVWCTASLASQQTHLYSKYFCNLRFLSNVLFLLHLLVLPARCNPSLLLLSSWSMSPQKHPSGHLDSYSLLFFLLKPLLLTSGVRRTWAHLALCSISVPQDLSAFSARGHGCPLLLFNVILIERTPSCRTKGAG